MRLARSASLASCSKTEKRCDGRINILWESYKLFLGVCPQLFGQRDENVKTFWDRWLWVVAANQVENKAAEPQWRPPREPHDDRWRLIEFATNCLFKFFFSVLDGLDLIVIPGVAFSPGGGRLGHGMGYYDKYLHKYFNKFPNKPGDKKTLLVGFGFREQIVNDNHLPVDPLDYPLDMILTSDWNSLNWMS